MTTSWPHGRKPLLALWFWHLALIGWVLTFGAQSPISDIWRWEDSSAQGTLSSQGPGFLSHVSWLPSPTISLLIQASWHYWQWQITLGMSSFRTATPLRPSNSTSCYSAYYWHCGANYLTIKTPDVWWQVDTGIPNHRQSVHREAGRWSPILRSQNPRDHSRNRSAWAGEDGPPAAWPSPYSADFRERQGWEWVFSSGLGSGMWNFFDSVIIPLPLAMWSFNNFMYFGCVAKQCLLQSILQTNLSSTTCILGSWLLRLWYQRVKLRSPIAILLHALRRRIKVCVPPVFCFP